MSFLSSTYKRGTTLVEILLYIAAASGIILVLSTLFVDTMTFVLRNKAIQEVESQGDRVMEIVGQKVRNAQDIVEPLANTGGGQLRMTLPSPEISPVIVRLNQEQIELQEGTGAYLPLTGEEVIASQLQIYHNRQGSSASGAQIRFTLTSKVERVFSTPYSKTFTYYFSAR